MTEKYTVAVSRTRGGEIRYTIGDKKPRSDTWIGVATFDVSGNDVRLEYMEVRREVTIDFESYPFTGFVQIQLMTDFLRRHLRKNEN